MPAKKKNKINPILAKFFKDAVHSDNFLKLIAKNFAEIDFSYYSNKLDEPFVFCLLDLVNCKDKKMKEIAYNVAQQSLSKRCIDKALASKDCRLMCMAIENARLTKEQELICMTCEYEDVRGTAADSCHASKTVLGLALQDASRRVRMEAVSNSEMLNYSDLAVQALSSRSPDIRTSITKYACWSKTVCGADVHKAALVSKWTDVRIEIAESSVYLTEGQWHTLLEDPNKNVRKAARKHPNAKKWKDPLRALLRKARAARKAGKVVIESPAAEPIAD
jgi:hypothetical protein